jgi:hypothetical protein
MKKLILTISIAFALTLTAIAGTVRVAWTPHTDTTVQGYKLYSLNTTNGIFNSTNTSMTLVTNIVNRLVTTNTVTITTNGLYRFAVLAYNVAGDSPFSSEVSTNFINVPTAPIGLYIQAVTP